MNSPKQILRGLVWIAAFSCFSAVADAATAATWTGSGSDGNTSTVANWSSDPNAVEVTGADITFEVSTNTAVNNDHFTSVNKITFASGASSYTLGGTAIELATTTPFMNQSDAEQTINLNLTGSGDVEFHGQGTNSVTVLGGNLTGFGNLFFDRLTDDGMISTFTLSGNNNPTGISLGAARVNITNENALGTGTITYGSTLGQLVNTSGSALTLSNHVDHRNPITFDSPDSITFSGGLQYSRSGVPFDITVSNTPLIFQGGKLTLATYGTPEEQQERNEKDFIKLGTGTLVLEFDATEVFDPIWMGQLQISAGTLLLNSDTGNNIGTKTGSDYGVTVSAAAVLAGTGRIGNNLLITGSLRPGNSIGTMTVHGNVTWAGTGSAGTDDWVFELGASNTSDLLDITAGAFEKGEGSNFIFDFADAENTGTFTLVQWTSTDNLGGGAPGTNFQLSDFSFTGLDEVKYAGSYFAFSGQSLTFTVIP